MSNAIGSLTLLPTECEPCPVPLGSLAAGVPGPTGACAVNLSTGSSWLVSTLTETGGAYGTQCPRLLASAAPAYKSGAGTCLKTKLILIPKRPDESEWSPHRLSSPVTCTTAGNFDFFASVIHTRFPSAHGCSEDFSVGGAWGCVCPYTEVRHTHLPENLDLLPQSQSLPSAPSRDLWSHPATYCPGCSVPGRTSLC